jgi:hypothetical protein
MQEYDFEEFVRKSRANAPRLGVFSEFFREITQGKGRGMPVREVLADRAMFRGDRDVNAFCDEYERTMGHFNHHFVASIPYIMENECRVGVALVEYAGEIAREGELVRMYCIANGDGNFSRPVSGMPGSKILSLTNFSEQGCVDSFYRYGVPHQARLFKGTYLELTPERIAADDKLAEFREGFDIIFEHEAFQMFGNNREEQLAFVTRLLKEDGLMLLNEKLNQEDMSLYYERERKKDRDFKTRYFTDEQIDAKQDDIVQYMENCQVTLGELTQALGKFFKHAVLVWNSTNFNLVVASNSEARIRTLLRHMLPPCIPPEFRYEDLPQSLLGMPSGPVAFGRC